MYNSPPPPPPLHRNWNGRLWDATKSVSAYLRVKIRTEYKNTHMLAGLETAEKSPESSKFVICQFWIGTRASQTFLSLLMSRVYTATQSPAQYALQYIRCKTCLLTYIFISVCIWHAAVESAVLEAPQIAVIHQNIQDGRHLTEDQNLDHNKTINHTQKSETY